MAVDFTVATDVFAGLVAKVDKIVERRNTIPILSNVLVTANFDGSLSVEGTDLDLWMRAETTEAAATVRTAGSITVPQKLLYDLLRKATKGEIRFREEGTHAVLSAGRSTFKLLALPQDDWPDIKGVSQAGATEFALPPARLLRVWTDCGFAISTEETRYYLNGVFFHAVEGRLVTVATDGHRLSRLAQDAIGAVEGMPGIIVPRKTVDLFKDLAEWTREGEDIAIRLDENKIEFAATGFTLSSKLIDGTFPDYDRVIPKANSKIVAFAPKPMQEAVDRVSTVSSERGRAVKLAFGEDAVRLTVNSPDAGTAEDEVAVAMREPFAIEVGFNAQYLAKVLSSFAAPGLEIALEDPGSPTVFRNPKDDDRLVVLMPMRV